METKGTAIPTSKQHEKIAECTKVYNCHEKIIKKNQYIGMRKIHILTSVNSSSVAFDP